jgi:transposase-like protein
VTRYRFVAQYQPQYGVRRCCRAVGVSPSSFYDWHRRLHHPSARARSDQALTAQITKIHQQSGGILRRPPDPCRAGRSPAGSGSAASESPG